MTTTRDQADRERRLSDLYLAFNRRDVPALLAAVTRDVRWPNGWEGGVVDGREDLAAYWRRQWAQIEPSVEPTAFTAEADGRIAVTVRQLVRDKRGTQLADNVVTHVYRFVGELIAEMEIRDQRP
ncbi:nuclear transport factor 2 family protein [Plantactinospora siamensis]|uniref:Nuclear transport factor 2 family protein n=1 Tax=Plantactinospora siamensis TaxID=555372 RepID=A0ABV6P476_9ACTN